jgi:hypothetical protein
MLSKYFWIGPGALAFAILYTALGFNHYQIQFVDGPSSSQSLICDGSDKVITFPNFVTAQVWLEQIRWEKSGSYTFGMEYDVGEKIALSYRCTKA